MSKDHEEREWEENEETEGLPSRMEIESLCEAALSASEKTEAQRVLLDEAQAKFEGVIEQLDGKSWWTRSMDSFVGATGKQEEIRQIAQENLELIQRRKDHLASL
jgi:hypothetical protein